MVVRLYLTPFPELYDDSTVIAFADARRFNLGVLGQGEVDDPPLVRWHGLQRDRSTRLVDSPRNSAGQVPQRLVPAFLVPGDVEEQVDSLADFAAGQKADHELEGSKGLASPPDQKAGVIAVNVEDRAADVLSVGLL